MRFASGLAGRVAAPVDVRHALAEVGLRGFEAQLARHLSQGQKRRVALARLYLAAQAPVWVLDEPFTALDVRGVASLSDLIAGHLARGGLVILTTHQDVPIAGRVEKLTLVPAAAPGDLAAIPAQSA